MVWRIRQQGQPAPCPGRYSDAWRRGKSSGLSGTADGSPLKKFRHG